MLMVKEKLPCETGVASRVRLMTQIEHLLRWNDYIGAKYAGPNKAI
jgi:hypothetical protein